MGIARHGGDGGDGEDVSGEPDAPDGADPDPGPPELEGHQDGVVVLPPRHATHLIHGRIEFVLKVIHFFRHRKKKITHESNLYFLFLFCC